MAQMFCSLHNKRFMPEEIDENQFDIKVDSKTYKVIVSYEGI